MEVYKVLGVMSGTSLDGLDLAYCEMIKGEKWTYKIGPATTISYTEKRKKILQNAIHLTGEELTALDFKFGKYIGEECKKFISKNKLAPDFISSHGHTIFHQPAKGFTLQIGEGSSILAETGIPVICNFRSQDVSLGGQGAPLVPLGDEILFSEYDACLNLGGFANISQNNGEKRVAWDICAVNVVLNYYAMQMGVEYDNKGAIARNGNLHEKLLSDLNLLEYYQKLSPKSLGIEWVQNDLMYVLNRYHIPTTDVLHTYVCHIAEIIGGTIIKSNAKQVLVTGGGIYNDFLLEKIREVSPTTIVIPDDATVQFKEALIFGLLGILKWRGEINVLKSVTGASRDHSSGVIYGQG